MAEAPVLPIRLTKVLTLDQALPDGRAHASAASGLVQVGDTFVVALDDEHHIGVFPRGRSGAGRALRILPGDLPVPSAERKRHKPDVEAIVRIDGEHPHDADIVVAFGSGSAAHRSRAIVFTIMDDDGLGVSPDAVLDLDALYGRLRAEVPDLNIEAAVVLERHLVLVARANGSVRHNTVIRFPIDAVRNWIDGRGDVPVPVSVDPLDLGSVDGVPLGVTDATLHPDGGWLVSAAAEDTLDSYADGRVVGAALVWLSATLDPIARWTLNPIVKVEGITADRHGSTIRVAMVTDADDPTAPAGLYEAILPAVR
jgi:hypothetical protein